MRNWHESVDTARVSGEAEHREAGSSGAGARRVLPPGEIEPDDIGGLMRSLWESSGLSLETFGQRYFGFSGETAREYCNGRNLERITLFLEGLRRNWGIELTRPANGNLQAAPPLNR